MIMIMIMISLFGFNVLLFKMIQMLVLYSVGNLDRGRGANEQM